MQIPASRTAIRSLWTHSPQPPLPHLLEVRELGRKVGVGLTLHLIWEPASTGTPAPSCDATHSARQGRRLSEPALRSAVLALEKTPLPSPPRCLRRTHWSDVSPMENGRARSGAGSARFHVDPPCGARGRVRRAGRSPSHPPPGACLSGPRTERRLTPDKRLAPFPGLGRGPSRRPAGAALRRAELVSTLGPAFRLGCRDPVPSSSHERAEPTGRGVRATCDATDPGGPPARCRAPGAPRSTAPASVPGPESERCDHARVLLKGRVSPHKMTRGQQTTFTHPSILSCCFITRFLKCTQKSHTPTERTS